MDLRFAGARLKKALRARGIEPKMSFANGELEVLVDGSRVYSYKQEHPLLSDEELLQRVESKLN